MQRRLSVVLLTLVILFTGGLFLTKTQYQTAKDPTSKTDTLYPNQEYQAKKNSQSDQESRTALNNQSDHPLTGKEDLKDPASPNPQAKQNTESEAEPNNNTTKVNQSSGSSRTSITSKSAIALEQELLALVNAERKKKGLNSLQADTQISNLARTKAKDMKDNNYFSTKSPTYGNFTEMLKAEGIKYRTATEKIAGGYQGAQEVFNNWLKDPGFKSSILEPKFTHIGAGYAAGGGQYHYYWTLWLVEKPSSISAESKANYEKEVLRLVNLERSNKSLSPLQWDNELTEVARAKSKDMRDKNYFAHQSPTYGSLGEMLQTFGVSYGAAAENIAAGQKTPQSVVEAWMNSEGHRKNILDPKLTHLGVGYADGGGDYFVYWTQIFTSKP